MPLPLLLALALQTTVPAADPKSADRPADVPSSAPVDDFGFVAWCRGALSGHMELYPSVKPEMVKVEEEKAQKEDARFTEAQKEAAKVRRAKEAREDEKLDQEQLAAGKEYLKLYTEALETAEQASASNLRKRADEAQDAGFRIWAAARQAEPRTRMWSWIMWELPARCETAARRLKEHSSLLAGVLKAPEKTAVAEAAPPPPAPTPAADPAPASSDAPPAGLNLRGFEPRRPTLGDAPADGASDAPAPGDAPSPDTASRP